MKRELLVGHGVGKRFVNLCQKPLEIQAAAMSAGGPSARLSVQAVPRQKKPGNRKVLAAYC
jgi:hypothetical protein